ncbi:hypothetical protein B0H63DRAFT_190945 [Podospora didyma]|uniref:NACHT domain-containing protein n=1 Tax=Podospora didyma TaxID=330526 RepID=A0AAE0NR79_9PEZI|nr:hypothetical protein B0H63DRAFT_190945 [Podospora didyma]
MEEKERQSSEMTKSWPKGADRPPLLDNGSQTHQKQQCDVDAILLDEFKRLQMGRRQNSKVERFMNKTLPLFRVIQRYSKAGDIASNACPEILTPLWASLRVVINIGIKFEEYFTRLVDMLQRIADILPRYQIYDQLFGHHSRLRDAIAELYGEVQEFVCHAKDVFESSLKVFRKSVWKTFDEEFEDTLVQIRRCSDIIEAEADAAHMIEQDKSREKISQTLVELSCVRNELQELKMAIKTRDRTPTLAEVGEWLNARQCHEERSQVLAKRLPDIDEWSSRCPGLHAWMNQDETQLLWVHGPPGCGKTFFYSKLLDYIESYAHDRRAFYFFFCEADKERVSLSSLLRVWAFQLIRLIWDAGESSKPLQHIKTQLACRTHREATADQVLDLLISLLKMPDMPSCFFTADALDECMERRAFFNFFARIPKRFKFLVTSLELPDIQNQLRSLEGRSSSLAITPDLTRADINHYLSQELKSLTLQDGTQVPDHIKVLINKRLSKSNGMFLWIRLMLEHIRDQTTVEEISSCLQDLPKGLCDRYDRIMCDINALPDQQRLLAHKVFFWVLVSERPLTAREVCAAQAVRPTSPERDSSLSSLNRRILGDPRLAIPSVCGSLVQARGEEGFLYPAHSSVTKYLKKYMASGDRMAEIAIFYGLPPASDSDTIAAAVCMRYLSSTFIADLHCQLPENEETAENLLSRCQEAPQFDLLQYATTHWFEHARRITQNNPAKEQLLQIATELLDSEYANAEIMWRLYWFSDAKGKARSTSTSCPTKFSGVHFAAYFGLAEIMRHLLSNHPDAAAALDGEGRAPIWWAAAQGYTHVVRTLIDAGADMEHHTGVGLQEIPGP